MKAKIPVPAWVKIVIFAVLGITGLIVLMPIFKMVKAWIQAKAAGNQYEGGLGNPNIQFDSKYQAERIYDAFNWGFWWENDSLVAELILATPKVYCKDLIIEYAKVKDKGRNLLSDVASHLDTEYVNPVTEHLKNK